jgi:hypothetical protein
MLRVSRMQAVNYRLVVTTFRPVCRLAHMSRPRTSGCRTPLPVTLC